MYKSRGRYIYGDTPANTSVIDQSGNNVYTGTSSSSELPNCRPVHLDPEQFDDIEDDCKSVLVPVSIEDILSDCNKNSKPQMVEVKENIESSVQRLNNNLTQNMSLNESLNCKLSFDDSSKEDINNPLVQFKNKLRIFETTRRESFITSVTNFFNHEDTTLILVKQGLAFMIQKCLEKPFWSEILACHSKLLGNHKTFGLQFKHEIFSLLQTIFEERSSLQEQYPRKFSNSVILLGEFFLRYRTPLNSRFRVFSAPLCELLHMLCKTASEEDMRIIAQQISTNGPTFKEYNDDEYESFLLEIRLRLLETTVDTVRLWLLLSLDIAFYGQNLPSMVEKMYANTLGSNIFNELKPPDDSELCVSVPSNLASFYNDDDTISYKKNESV